MGSRQTDSFVGSTDLDRLPLERCRQRTTRQASDHEGRQARTARIAPFVPRSHGRGVPSKRKEQSMRKYSLAILGLLVATPAIAFRTDNGLSPPPATGTYAYNHVGPPASSYVDPVFGETVR